MMNVVDWMGITLVGIGTIGVGAGGEEQKASIISVFHLPWLAIVVAFLFVLLNGWLRIYRRQRKEQELMEYEIVEEIIYGLESGILFGMASVISKMGFVFLEQGFHSMLVPICVIISICCSGTGFYYQTRDPPIIPPLSTLFEDGTDPVIVVKRVKKYLEFGKSNKESLADLFVTLLVKMASVETLWQKGLCASLYEGCWTSKLWDTQYNAISVEDFTDRSQNVARR